MVRLNLPLPPLVRNGGKFHSLSSWRDDRNYVASTNQGHGQARRVGQAGWCRVWLFDSRRSPNLRLAGSTKEDG